MTEPSHDLVINFEVNGRRRRLTVPARRTLADVLRDDLGLTGTKLGCEQGVCGACTVLFDEQPARACLILIGQASGHRVETIEELAQGHELNELQQSFARQHALQCGFCTAGFLMSATALLRDTPTPTVEQVRETLSGHICRCTGYEKILRAVLDCSGATP